MVEKNLFDSKITDKTMPIVTKIANVEQNNKNETYTGQLTTGSDSYFDREAYSS